MTPEVDSESHEGCALYLGARYDITSSKTMIGLEYNHGSKQRIGMVPAADDLWTSKLGTRGDVFEAYIIQELKQKLISKKGKAFFRLGYQYYDFEYTGSNSWVGASKKISDLNTMDPSGKRWRNVRATEGVVFQARKRVWEILRAHEATAHTLVEKHAVQRVQTDETGHYVLVKVPTGKAYIYARLRERKEDFVWFLPVEVETGRQRAGLTQDNQRRWQFVP